MQSRSNSRVSCGLSPIAAMAGFVSAAALIGLITSGTFAAAQLPEPKPNQTTRQPAPQPGPQTTQPSQAPPQSAQAPAPNQNLNLTKPSPSTRAPMATQSPIPEQPKPDWPVNNKPEAAKVTWDTHGLAIEANNSSLEAILKDVATATGAKVEGKVGDERVFGSFGPGPARDVISQLLDGTTYNVMLVGDQGEGTPRQIFLSNRPSGPAPLNSAQNNNNDDSPEYEPQQQMPGVPIVHNGFPAPGMPPEQNQQQMEERRAEMEQRQEQMRQQLEQQQQQQQQQPQQPPNPQQ
jgi:hypothetical protein